MRRANPIDFWRGVALVMIFINHVPDNAYAYWTLHRFALSDAAELFVFLAGWSLSYATGGPAEPEPARRTVLRLTYRAIQIYRAQLVVTAIALALLAFVALWRNNPLYLEWNNAGPAFYDPMRTTVGWVAMTHQLHFVDILPMYVVLLLFAPVLVLLTRRSRLAGLALSLGLYLLAITTRTNFPSWPSAGGWYFNPIAWQFMLFIGFVSAELTREGGRLAAVADRLAPLAWVVVIASATARINVWSPDPFDVPSPKLLFLFDKTYLTPARLLSCLALVVVFRNVFDLIAPHIAPVTRYLAGLGRNSLAVFCVGSLLSLAGQIVRFVAGGSLTIDTSIVLFGLLGMGITTWFVEWRDRSRSLSQSPVSS